MCCVWGGGDGGRQCLSCQTQPPPPATRCPPPAPQPGPPPARPHNSMGSPAWGEGPSPPSNAAPSPSHLFLLLFGFGGRREGAEVGDGPIEPPSAAPPPPVPPPHLKKGGAIAGSRCHQCPERFRLSWGEKTGVGNRAEEGGGSLWGRGGAGGSLIPRSLLLFEPHGLQALRAGDEGDVPPLLH